jgi:hypothetical protein
LSVSFVYGEVCLIERMDSLSRCYSLIFSVFGLVR